jgi:nucleoid DNA-binding protein
MAKVTKENLVEVLAKKVCCSKKEAVDCLNVLLDEIKSALKKGQDVVLTGFGTFTVSKRKARTGRNPQTGATIKIPAKKVPRFKAGKGLKDAVK